MEVLKTVVTGMLIGLAYLHGGSIVLLDVFTDDDAARSEKNRAQAYLRTISPKAVESLSLRRDGEEWLLLLDLPAGNLESREKMLLPLARRYPKLLVMRSGGEVPEKTGKETEKLRPFSPEALLWGVGGLILLLIVWFGVRLRHLGNIRGTAGKMEKRFEHIRRELDEQ